MDAKKICKVSLYGLRAAIRPIQLCFWLPKLPSMTVARRFPIILLAVRVSSGTSFGLGPLGTKRSWSLARWKVQYKAWGTSGLSLFRVESCACCSATSSVAFSITALWPFLSWEAVRKSFQARFSWNFLYNIQGNQFIELQSGINLAYFMYLHNNYFLEIYPETAPWWVIGWFIVKLQNIY